VEFELSRQDELLDGISSFAIDWPSRLPSVAHAGHHFWRRCYSLEPSPRTAGRDIAIILDHSGSNAGHQMQSAIIAVSKFLQTLSRQDRFAILAFNNTVTPYGKPVVRRAGRTSGRQWLQAVTAGGGTELKGAWMRPESPGRW